MHRPCTHAGIGPILNTPDGTAAGGCAAVLPSLARGATVAFEFSVATGSEMSLMLTMRTRGGTADM